MRHGGLPSEVRARQEFAVTLEISNPSALLLSSMKPFPVHMSYHWIRDDGQIVVFEGVRTRLLPHLEPRSSRSFAATVVSPALPGRYVLRLTLVQEMVQWFDAPSIAVMADSFIEVIP
jgi:hypothetical protein